MTAQGRRIALCVDDFGLHEGVNAAVFRLAELGRVNAVSCLVGAPAWKPAAAALAAWPRTAVELGLHLDFTECPLRLPRRRLSGLLAAAYARRLRPARLRDEIEAQLDAFEQQTRRQPDYVDGHQHVHQLPLVRDALLQTLARRYPGRLPWLRSTRAAARTAAKPRIIEALGAAGLARAARGHRFSGRLLGVHDFQADAAGYRRLLDGWLALARDGDLLMCHPAAPLGPALQAPSADALLASRTAEFAVLSAADFEALLERHHVKLAPLGSITAPAAS